MTPAIIITFCLLLLIAYIFNLTSGYTKIPSVILLLLLGWGIQQVTSYLEISLPSFSPILPVLATIGLVLIVLEGALELNLNKSKIGLITKSFFGALLPIIAMSFILSFAFQMAGGHSLKIALINAIPLSIISSAIAIPSVANLKDNQREFVIYESSLSDVMGVLFFNFIALNEDINQASFTFFGLQVLIMIIVSIIATFGLSFLLGKINHHVKFVPLILLVVLIYEISKVLHLPALIFILIFGLSLGNLHLFKGVKWLNKIKTDDFEEQIEKFKDLTIEGAFLLRALFFILFGYLIETSEVLNLATLPWSAGIVIVALILRFLQLKLSNIPIKPLLFVFPRGLITILLFIAILPEDHIPLVNRSLIIQIIILTALIMAGGIIANKEEKEEIDEQLKPEDSGAISQEI